MKVTNPTNGTLDVVLEGRQIVLGPGESTDITEHLARLWQERLHPFLILEEKENPSDVLAELKTTVEETETEEVEEEAEVVEEEVEVEEKKESPKGKKKSNK